jgi:hypothetical protein
MTTRGYYALVYLTVTGEVVGTIPLATTPTWQQVYNADGSWTIETPLGAEDGMSRDDLADLTDDWRFSIAVCRGDGSPSDYVCQAGPILSDAEQDKDPPTLQIGGTGLWPVLKATLQVPSTWNGVSVGLGAGADSTYTSSMQGIAVAVLANAKTRNPVPLDLPVAIAGSTTRSEFGYNFNTAGDFLYALTQDAAGPDVLLKPYRYDDSHIHHLAVIGTPSLANAGNPLVFDYPGNILKILRTRNGSARARTTYQKGNGSSYDTMWASTTNTSLDTVGFPKLESVSISTSASADQATLQGAAAGAEALNIQRQVLWDVTALMDDEDVPFGSFDPGGTAQYNLQGHRLIRDGVYSRRILGLSNGDTADTYKHIVAAMTSA